MSELIEVVQLPKIVEQLHSIKADFEARAAAVSSVICTADNYKRIKADRAEITKIYNELESRRKAVKAEILKPYDEFVKVYDECITNVYKPVKAKLDESIAEVEGSLIDQKRQVVEDYFYEYAASFGIDFVPFSRANIKVNMSTSEKKSREEAKAYIDGVVKDLELMATQDESIQNEILYEYKKNLDIAASITTVVDRHRAIDDRSPSGFVTGTEPESEMNESPKPLAAPTVEADEAEETKHLMSFRVRGTISQLKQLKEFIINNEIEIVEE